MIPAALVCVVLTLGAFRLARLVGWDDLPPVEKLRAKLIGEVAYYNDVERKGAPIYRYRRPALAKFVHCPWCQGFWVSLLVYLAWLAWPTGTVYALAPFALSAAVGLLARNLDP